MKKILQIRSDSGFTLIELLVAIAVSGIVLAGLVQVFSIANRSYTHQDEMATLQQNLRVAKMNLERDIRMAGCGFGSAFFNQEGNPVFPLVNTNGGAAGSDSLIISYVDYDDPCNEALPQWTTTVMSPCPCPDTWTTGVPCAVAPPFFAVYTRAVDLHFPTILRSDVCTVSNVTGVSTLQCSGMIIPPNSSIKFFSATQLITVTYSFDSASRTLMRKQQPADVVPLAIAEGIEDFQLAFGLDTTVPADGIVDSWINDVVMDNIQMSQVRQIRITILGRSSRTLPGQLPNTRPPIEDHVVGTVSEKYLRQLIQFEIKPRNIKG